MRFHVICAVLAISALAAIRTSNAGEAGCSAVASDGCSDGCGCCPKCGCHEGMIPVCHNYCELKKTTKYHYCCKCEEICCRAVMANAATVAATSAVATATPAAAATRGVAAKKRIATAISTRPTSS